MPTPFESAQLLLTLYDHRREDVMRQARGFFVAWDPQSFDEVMSTLTGPNSGLMRMVVTYWDMAACFVEHGAINRTMFNEITGEHVLVFGKIQPFLPQLRETLGNPEYLKNLEKMVMAMPEAQKVIDTRLARVRALVARRAAAGKA
jgi:hypothetical protein